MHAARDLGSSLAWNSWHLSRVRRLARGVRCSAGGLDDGGRSGAQRVARTYNATISYKELGGEVQYVTGIHTRVLLMNWIGQVLGGASRISRLRGQPMLSALCVHSDGMVGEGYGQAILENYGGPLPGDLDMHAAEERLRCYKSSARTCHPAVEGLLYGAGRRAQGLAGAAVKSRCSNQSVPVVQLGIPILGICDNCG